MLEGGPRHGWWYFADDVASLRAAAERMGRAWPYAPTSRTAGHPIYAAVGDVHTFSEETST